MFSKEGRSNDAHAHIERAKPYAANNTYHLACALLLQARVWDRQHRFEEARSEALRALEMFEKLGAASDVDRARRFLQRIDHAGEEMDNRVTCDESGEYGELLQIMLLAVCINSSFWAGSQNPNDVLQV